MFDIKTPEEAIKIIGEAASFITEVEDEIYDNKINEETTSKLETAYIEIDQVAGYLQTLTKENK